MQSVQCPECGKTLMLMPSMAGRKVQCSGCQGVVLCPTTVATRDPITQPRSSSPPADARRNEDAARNVDATMIENATRINENAQILYPAIATSDSNDLDHSATRVEDSSFTTANLPPENQISGEEAAEWYVITEVGKQVGPVSKKRVQTWWKEGVLNSRCQVCQLGWTSWKWADEAFSPQSTDDGSNVHGVGGGELPGGFALHSNAGEGSSPGSENRSIQLSKQELPGLRLAIRNVEEWGWAAAWSRAFVLLAFAGAAAYSLAFGLTGKLLLDRTLGGGALCVVCLEFVGLLAAWRWHQQLPKVRKAPTADKLARSLHLASSMLAAITFVHLGLLLVLGLAAYVYWAYRTGALR